MALVRGVGRGGSCHGDLNNNNTGSRSFEEQPAAYTQAQLQVFASDDATTTSATRCATSRATTPKVRRDR
jgi:cytochrome c553